MEEKYLFPVLLNLTAYYCTFIMPIGRSDKECELKYKNVTTLIFHFPGIETYTFVPLNRFAFEVSFTFRSSNEYTLRYEWGKGVVIYQQEEQLDSLFVPDGNRPIKIVGK